MPFILKTSWVAARLACLSLFSVPVGKMGGLSSHTSVSQVGSVQRAVFVARVGLSGGERVPNVTVRLLMHSGGVKNGWMDRNALGISENRNCVLYFHRLLHYEFQT